MIEFASPPSEAMLEAPCVGREPAFKGVMRFRCRLASVRSSNFGLGIRLRAGHRVVAPCRFGALAQRKAVATYKSRIKAPPLCRHQSTGAQHAKDDPDGHRRLPVTQVHGEAGNHGGQRPLAHRTGIHLTVPGT